MKIHADKLYKRVETTDGSEGAYMLRLISFEIGQGEHVLVTGASGSGKTTLLSLIAGLQKPTGGTLSLAVDGGASEKVSEKASEKVSEKTSEKASGDNRVSMMFQENRLLNELSAVRNIQVILPKHFRRTYDVSMIDGSGKKTGDGGRSDSSVNHSEPEARESVEALIRRHLENVLPGVSLDKPVSELSGGERRRVALVRAILAPGEVLLLDEPFTGLDEAATQTVKEYIERETAGRTVLLTDHEGTHFPEWRKIECV